MTRLSGTQLTILAAAAQRSGGNLLPLPTSLRGGAAGKVVGALLARGLIREEITTNHAGSDATLNAFWRNEEDDRGVMLLITAAGLEGRVPDASSESRYGEEVPRPILHFGIAG